jgi:DNA-binding transcriptional LysR family regulator
MNSWHLKYFIEAAKNKSLQSAAQKYFVTPSAISQAIKSLEGELGADLLVHQKRMFSLTPAGQVFLDKAIALIAEIDHLPGLIKSTEKDPQGVIRFVALRSFFTDELARQIVKLKKKYPKPTPVRAR